MKEKKYKSFLDFEKDAFPKRYKQRQDEEKFKTNSTFSSIYMRE